MAKKEDTPEKKTKKVTSTKKQTQSTNTSTPKKDSKTQLKDASDKLKNTQAETTKNTQEANQQSSTTEGYKRPSDMFMVAGEISWLIAKSMHHQFLFISELEWLIFPPIISNQYYIFRDKQGYIFGVALWANVNEEVDERLSKHAPKLKPNEWNCGNITWLIDFISPFGQQEKMINYLRTHILKDKKIKVQKHMEDGSVQVTYL